MIDRLKGILRRLSREQKRAEVEAGSIVCNICGTVFVDLSGPHPERQACPGCQAVSRERFNVHALLCSIAPSIEEELVLARATSLKHLRVLEMSPRRNDRKEEIYRQAFGTYEISDFDNRRHKANLSIDLCDGKLPASEAETFDVVICAHILEHVPDVDRALNKLVAMTRPNGFALVQVPVVEAVTIPVTWDEFHGDDTRVIHRFGLDLAERIVLLGHQVVLEQIHRPPGAVSHPEIHQDKYKWQEQHPEYSAHFCRPGHARLFGLGRPDFVETFVVRRGQ